MKVYAIVVECLSTDGKFNSEVYLEPTAQRAGECATGLIAQMADKTGLDDIDPTARWELEGSGWYYKVRTEEMDAPYTDDDKFEIVEWPDIQFIMHRDGFRENAHLILDTTGMKRYGSSAYFVNSRWLHSQETENR